VNAATINNKSKETVTGKEAASIAKPQGNTDSGTVNRGAMETVYPSEKESFKEM